MHDHDSGFDLGFFGHHHTGEGPLDFLFGNFKHALIIAVFVVIMMLLVEYLTILSKGRWNKALDRSPWLQILIAALLGLTPGCLGAYMVVSLYAHKVFSFAAIVTVMIATSGDEAFVMFAMIPEKALLIMGALFILSITAGFMVRALFGKRSFMKLEENLMKVHFQEPDCRCFDRKLILPQLRSISWPRLILILGGLVFGILLLTGTVGPSDWNWKRVVFLIVTGLELFIVTTVPDHFLKVHFWQHIIKKHFLRIFLWIFGAFLLIHAGLEYLDISNWIRENLWLVLMIALLVGIIPESGPHLIFLTLFVNGIIPISILIANSVVQDGHASLPLLAESRLSFVYMKLFNLLIGLVIGSLGILAGF